MHLSSRNKVFISGIVGAAILIAGFDLLMSGYASTQQAPGLQFPGREQDGVPGGFYLAAMGMLLVAVSGMISGVLYTALDRAGTLKTTLARSALSGAASGLLIFLVSCAMIVVSASVSGPLQAAVDLFTGAFDMAPLFIALLVVLAAFGVIGGAAAKLTVMGINKIKKSSG